MAVSREILVAGDMVLDHHIYEGKRHHYGDGINPGVIVKPQPGGAALVHEILSELVKKSAGARRWSSHVAVKLPTTNADFLKVDRSQHAYAFWRAFPADATSDKQYWRVSDAMGFGASAHPPVVKAWQRNTRMPKAPAIVVLSEGGMGFRQLKRNWQRLPLDTAQAIVFKTAAPLATGELWNTLTRRHRERLIVVVSALELRKSEARLSTGLSWDETVERIARELQPRRALASLAHCRHLIITFSSEGAIWLDNHSGEGHLVYDPASIEGDQDHDVPGTAFGFLSCMAATVAWQITRNRAGALDLEPALESGLAAMRDLRANGHGPVLAMADGFPTKRIAAVISEPTSRYSRARLRSDAPLTGGAKHSWSLLKEAEHQHDAACFMARLVALRGSVAFANVPHLSVGKLLAVDRQEVESLRSLAQVIRRYADNKERGEKPLSIGVFGPPGAGKSFSVKQLSEKFVGKDHWLTFNLSQFATPDDLIGAYHQVRDRVLQGALPVAFFDEFDSQSYRWLQYLLAPMQDGKFQDGQITHTIGKCIFIFAGGTSWTFEAFGPPKPAGSRESEAFASFRQAKGPDFKSRLDAYLNVVGPNRRQKSKRVGDAFRWVDDASDVSFPIRRALMIRSELKCEPDEKLDLDEGVLQGLLRVKHYEHGSRSLGKVLQPFVALRNEALVRSLLPPREQLRMHTRDRQFIEICDSAHARAWTTESMSGEQEMDLASPLREQDIEELAPAIHASYLRKKLGDKQIRKVFSKLKPAFLKESNRAAARRMVRILDLAGLQLEPGVAKPEDEAEIGRFLEFHLELLAEAEHEGWMQWHFNRGWRYAKIRDNKALLHDCLLPYDQLDHLQRNKDRVTIRAYPKYSRMAGRKITFRPS